MREPDRVSATTPAARAADAADAQTPTTGKSAYVLDSHGMIYQMFHGIGPMSAPDGRPTNAVFGVTRAIMDLYDHGADYLIAAFDRAEPTFRMALTDQYKANRTSPPDDLRTQEPMIAQVLEAMRIPVVSVAGYEADDVMATLARAGEERGLMVHLCTSDKDCRQLLTEHVKILNLRKGEAMDARGLVDDWGVRPEQVIDYQTLVGDSSDNVKGVPGCGPKTAAKWLAEYGTIANIIANIDKLGGPKIRQSFQRALDDGTIELARKLVTLEVNVPMKLDWEAWERREWDGQRLLELFAEFGFRGFANKVRSTLSKSGSKRNADNLAEAGISTGVNLDEPPRPHKDRASLFDSLDDDPAELSPVANVGRTDAALDFNFGANVTETWTTDYKLVDNEKAFKIFLKELRSQKRFVFDLETTAIDPLRAEIVGYAISWAEAEAFYLPVRGPSGAKLLDAAATLAALKPSFESAEVKKANQNIKYDELILRNNGVTVRGVDGDSMVADYLLHAGERSHGLDELARRYLKHENTPITELIGKGKSQLTMDQVDVDKVRAYACEDADVALRVTHILESELTEKGLKKLYDDVEVPLIQVLAEMEFNGVLLDIPYLAKLSVEMDAQLKILETEIHGVAGRSFNIGSPKQLREILFDEMKLPVQKRTGTTSEPSTDQESLEKLATLGHDLPRRIIDYRSVAKLKGTYVDALPTLVNPNTGRVHTSFNQTVTSTGRLSSSDPNLQNVPSRTDQGRQIRQAFIPPPGWQMLTADYSQIELRLLAHFCQDAQMLTAFAEDRDIHTQVAAEIFKVQQDEVTKQQRRVAKTVNFGVIYGISAHGLAVRIGTPRKEAEQFIDAYFARYPSVLDYQSKLLQNARRDGYVPTILGRRRAFDATALGRSGNGYQNRTTAEREAINMEIQGSAADLMKLAMLEVYKRLQSSKSRAKMLLSVHDELVFECPPEDAKPLADLVRTAMIGAMQLTVPLQVDVAAGPNWLDVEPL